MQLMRWIINIDTKRSSAISKVVMVLLILVWFMPIIPWTKEFLLIKVGFESLANYYAAMSAGSIFFAVYQYHSNAERNKKEKAVEAARAWNTQLNEVGSSARKLVDDLSPSDCKKLHNEESFSINGKIRLLRLKTVFSDNKELCKQIDDEIRDNGDEASYKIDETAASKLRWIIIDYLNSLETVLVAWQLKIVDRDIIEKEFSYLMDDGSPTLKSFRDVAGGNKSYPAIYEFENFMQNKKFIEI